MATKRSLEHFFAQVPPSLVRISRDVPARRLTTFGLGAAVDFLIEPLSEEGLSECLRLMLKHGVPWRAIAGGSNVVLPDCGLRIPVLHLGREWAAFAIEQMEELQSGLMPHGQSVSVCLGAGCSLMSVSKQCASEGLSGFEFAAGIPALIGGAVATNAGAHGCDLSKLLTRVKVVDNNGLVREVRPEDIGFSYRTSGLKRGDLVIGVSCELHVDEAQEVERLRSEMLGKRKTTQPLQFPSAGSVFKNPSRKTVSGEGSTLPENYSAGFLLESAGLKGERIAGLVYSDLHANWVIKDGKDASTSDLRNLVEVGQQRVHREFGVDLSLEIDIWDESDVGT